MKHTNVVKRVMLVSVLALVLAVGCTPTVGNIISAPGVDPSGNLVDGSSGAGSTPEAMETPETTETVEASETPEASGTPEIGEDFEITGTIDAINGNTITVNGQTFTVPKEMAALLAGLNPGDSVEIKAVVGPDGQIMIVEIKVEDGADLTAEPTEDVKPEATETPEATESESEHSTPEPTETHSGEDSGSNNGGGDH